MNFSLFSLLTIAAFIATTQSHNPKVIRPDGGQTARRLFKQRLSPAINKKEFDIRVDIEKETVINTNNERSNHLNSIFVGPNRRQELRDAFLRLQNKRKNIKNKVETVSSNLLRKTKSRSLLDRINPEMDADVPVGPVPDEELNREHGVKHDKPKQERGSRPEKQDPRGRPNGRPNKRDPKKDGRYNNGVKRGHNIDERIPEGKGAVPEPRPDSRQYNRYQKPKRGQNNSRSKPPKKEALKEKVDAEILKEKRHRRQKKFNKVKDTIKDTNEEEEETEIILIDIE